MTATVQHAINIETPQPQRSSLVASCLCGWQSPPCGDRPSALASGDRHLRVVPPIVCRPWCVEGDGHPGEMFVDDQRCSTTEQRIELSLHEKIEVGGGDTMPDYAFVYAAECQFAQTGIDIFVDRPDGLPLTFTPDEAKQLTEALQLVLGQVQA